MRENHIQQCLNYFDDNKDRYNTFCRQVVVFFEENKNLNSPPLPYIHTLKHRIKSRKSLEDKLNRKWEDGDEITLVNFSNKITDIGGVRVLHLYNDQFPHIHSEIMKHVNDHKEWVLFEQPKAYIWDKEKEQQYKDLGLDVQTKDSNYTSFHYVVKPNEASIFCCEIQVRTLLEETWGEIDHTINYPQKTNSIACAEQIKVMAKLVNAGSRLADSIFNSYKEHIHSKVPVE